MSPALASGFFTNSATWEAPLDPFNLKTICNIVYIENIWHGHCLVEEKPGQRAGIMGILFCHSCQVTYTYYLFLVNPSVCFELWVGPGQDPWGEELDMC